MACRDIPLGDDEDESQKMGGFTQENTDPILDEWRHLRTGMTVTCTSNLHWQGIATLTIRHGKGRPYFVLSSPDGMRSLRLYNEGMIRVKKELETA